MFTAHACTLMLFLFYVRHCNCAVSISFPGFPYEKVVQRTLYLQVLDYDRFSRNDPIGEVSIPLNKLDLANMQTFWKELKPCSDGSVSEKEKGGKGRRELEERRGTGRRGRRGKRRWDRL